MGFYYGNDKPPKEKQPSGCLETLLVMRAVFGLLFWPLVALVGLTVAAAVTFWAFAVHPALALIPVAIIGGAVWAYARWEQRHFRPPGL